MSASIQVSDLNYNTNNGTISSVNIKIGSQLFSITFEGNKYSVINKGDTLGKSVSDLKEPDKNLSNAGAAAPGAVTTIAAAPAAVTTISGAVNDSTTSFKNNDELIKILNERDFKSPMPNQPR